MKKQYLNLYDKDIQVTQELKTPYFSFEQFNKLFILPKYMPNIYQVVSVMMEPKIIKERVINTLKGTSADGKVLTGKKVALLMTLDWKVLYIANTPEKTLHTAQVSYLHHSYIVVPANIEGSDIEKLLEFKYLKNQVTSLDEDTIKIDETSLRLSTLLLAKTKFIPTYEICYTQIQKDKSDIYISYEDGTFKKRLPLDGRVMKAQWSLDGWYIGFLEESMERLDGYDLCVYDLKNHTVKNLTQEYEFDTVSSFSFCNDPSKLVFSASTDGEKQLFRIDLYTLEKEKLTFEHKEIKSYLPKCCKFNSDIAFLQSISNIADLCVLDTQTLKVYPITEDGYIKDFEWGLKGKFLVYVEGKSEKSPELYKVDAKNLKKTLIPLPPSILKIRKIKMNPTGRYLGIIGSDFITDNLYIYDFYTRKVNNLTQNFENITIKDMDFKNNSEDIYFTANDCNYYNLYKVSIHKNTHVYAITNTEAINMNIRYRPKII